MTTDNTRIPLDLSLDEFKLVHDALMAQPYGAVERIVAKLRQAAAAAMQKVQAPGRDEQMK